MAYAEEIAAANRNRSMKERFAARNAVRSKYGMSAEKRKRGGLAGTWDRNKGLIKPVVTGALGMIPGVGLPLAAGAGALMGGLDRPGKGGVGFDIGRGVRGAASGALAGAAGAGAKGLFTGAKGLAGAGTAMRDYAYQMPGVEKAFTGAPRVTGMTNVGGMPVVTTARSTPIGSALRGAGKWVGKNPIPVGQAITGAVNYRSTSQRNQMERQNQRIAMDEYNRRLADRERMANLLRPLFLQLQQRLGTGGTI